MKGKRGYIIGMTIIILVFGLWVIKNFNYRYKHDQIIDRDKITGLKKAPEKSDHKKLTEVDYIILNDEKAKAPSFHFIDQNRDSITDKNYNGKVYLVEFFYSTCPTICPIMNDNLAEIANEFKDRDDFGIASFSIDPKHDTPEVLLEYAEMHGVNHPNWHLLTGDQNQIYDLAFQGYRLTAQEDINEPGGIMHDGLFVLIDQDGYIRSRKDDFGNPLIYYRGYIERKAVIQPGDEEPQIDELIEDIHYLLENKSS